MGNYKKSIQKSKHQKSKSRIKYCKKIIENIDFIKAKFYEDKIKSNKTINLINHLTKNKKK